MLRRLLRDEDGSVVVAVIGLTLMLILGIATYSTVGTQTRLSAGDRVRESSFNLAEGALNAQTFIIGRLGPGNAQVEYPPQCTTSSTEPLCPTPATLQQSFSGTLQRDYADGQATWTTEVRDNGTGDFYDSSARNGPRRDVNGDNQMWVRSEAVVRGKRRAIVALVRVEARAVTFPRYALLAGGFATTNSGNKVIINATGSLGIAVRCSTPPKSPCLDYQPAKRQLEPNNYELSYPQQTAISTDDLAGLEELARASGTYYSGCPANPNGLVVMVEAGNCAYDDSAPGINGANCCNTPSAPGVFVVKNGTLSLTGNIDFFGIVYALNHQATTASVVTIGGTASVRGGVLVDGNGKVAAGASGDDIIYDPNPFNSARSFGTAGIVQNTWREIKG